MNPEHRKHNTKSINGVRIALIKSMAENCQQTDNNKQTQPSRIGITPTADSDIIIDSGVS